MSAPELHDGLSIRTVHALWNAGVKSWDTLAAQTPEQLLRMNNIGRKALAEVETRLAERGLSLAPSTRVIASCRQASQQEIARRARVIIATALEPMKASLEAGALACEEGARVKVALHELMRGFQ